MASAITAAKQLREFDLVYPLLPLSLLVSSYSFRRFHLLRHSAPVNGYNARAEIIQYKASVKALIPIYENNLKTAMEALVKRKELLVQGLVSKRDIDSGEQAVKDAQTQLDQTRVSNSQNRIN